MHGSPTRDDILYMEFASDIKWLHVAKLAVQQAASGLGFAREEAQACALALEEALLYTKELCYKDSQPMRLRLNSTALEFEIRLEFHGLPLDLERLPDYDSRQALFTGNTQGLSLLLMKRMMDAVSFATLGKGKREICLRKKLVAQPEREPAPKPVASLAEAPRYHVRPAEPDDARAISSLALRAHGDMLFSAAIYYPDKVRQMLQNGEMFSVLAESEQGEIMGHGALLMYAVGDRIVELTYGFVDPRYGKLGCASAMAEALNRQAVSMGLSAAIVFAVTNHVFSQRLLPSMDYSPTALFLAASPDLRTEGGERRIANVLYVKWLIEDTGVLLYAPPRHRAMMAGLYEAAGQKVRLEEPPADLDLPSEEAQVQTLSDFVEGWTHIDVVQHGADVLFQVQAHLQEAREQEVPVVILTLCLTSPLSAQLVPDFEEMGFFFAGVGVDQQGGHTLNMQSVNCGAQDYDGIHVLPGVGEELKGYVQSCDPMQVG